MTESTTGDIVPILSPLIDAFDAMATATEVLAGTGMAMANSPAMAEMAQGAAIGGADLQETVHAAHSNAGILRFAATDSLRQFARMFRDQPVPVYAHLAVARASLEAAAYSYWAIAGGIGVVARVQRYQAIRLHNCSELRRSPIPEFREQGSSMKAQIREQCIRRDWPVITGKGGIEVGDQRLPGSGALIKGLLAAGTEVQALQHLGATAWWFLSGVSHGVNYALLESVEVNDPLTSPLVPNVVPIFTSSRSVGFQGLILGHAYRTMMDEHRAVFGWSDQAWTDAGAQFAAEAKRILNVGGPGPEAPNS